MFEKHFKNVLSLKHKPTLLFLFHTSSFHLPRWASVSIFQY